MTVKTTARARPPQQFVDLLQQPEPAFRQYVRELESSPLFRSLVDQGLVTRIGLRGRVPEEKYQEFMDREFIRFLDETGIRSKPGWEDDLLSPVAQNRIPEISAKYDVPAGRLERFIRYLRKTTQDTDNVLLPKQSNSDEAWMDPLETARDRDSGIDLSYITQMFQAFVSRHGVSQQEFIDVVLGGELSSKELSERFQCSLGDAEHMLEALNEFHIVEMFEEGSTQGTQALPNVPAVEELAENPVATVRIQTDGRVAVEVPPDSLYAMRYRIAGKGIQLTEDAKEMLTVLRSINYRASILARIVTAVCEHQKEFLSTGNMDRIKPLSQAQIARTISEPRSTVNRTIRGKSLATDRGLLRLPELFPTKTEVIARLVRKHPDQSDNELRVILLKEYGCAIARRTVAYHRRKTETT